MTERFRPVGWRGLAATGALVALAAGCAPAEDPAVSRARAVIAALVAESPEYERYLLSIAGESVAPDLRSRVIAALGSDNLQTALAAVDALGDAPPAEALEPLRQVFASKGGALKRQAAIELARLGDASALEHLKSLTADRAQTLSPAACVVIAVSPGGEAFLTPLLHERLASEDPGVRGETYATLGELRQPWATQMLVEGLAQEHGEQRQPALAALGRAGDPAMASRIAPFVNTRGLVFASLEALGELGNPDGASAVESMAASAEPAVRVYAAAALWKLGRRSTAVPIANELMQSQDPTIRRVLADQLGSVDDAEAWSRLATLADDPNKDVRADAVRAIAGRERPESEEVLRDAAGDPEYEVSTVALAALGRIGGAESLSVAAPLLEDENPYVALSAAQAVLSIQARLPGS